MWSVIDRVVDGLSKALGLGHGLVITGFVLGFIFAPLLTAMVFFVALYWVSYPESAREHLEKVSTYIRRAGQRLHDAAFARRAETAAAGPGFEEATAPRSPGSADGSSGRREPHHTSLSELRARFEALDERAKSIEAFVTSEEYRLEREFKRMDDEPR